MTILVTGATGSVGSHVLAQLLKAGVKVRASSRKPEKAHLPEGLEVVRADLTQPETFDSALAGIQKVFLYANAEGVEGFVRAAMNAGVKHIVLLSSAAILDPDPTSFNAQRHRAVETAIQQSNIAWTFLRAGMFATNTLGWAHSIRAEGLVRMAYPNAQVAPIHEQDIADIAVAALLNDGVSKVNLKGQGPILTGPESIDQYQQVEAISAAIGKRIAVEVLTHDQARTQLSRTMPERFADVFLHYLARGNNRPPIISDSFERITGRRGRTYAQWAKDHASDFR